MSEEPVHETQLLSSCPAVKSVCSSTPTSSSARRVSGASSMSFQNDLCALRVLCGNMSPYLRQAVLVAAYPLLFPWMEVVRQLRILGRGMSLQHVWLSS